MIDTLTVSQLAQAVGLTFGLGVLLLLILSVLPTTRSTARKLWPLLASEGLILAAAMLPWFLPPAAVLLCVLLAACRIGFESGAVYSLITGKKLEWVCAGVLLTGSAAAWLTGPAPILWTLGLFCSVGVAALTMKAKSIFSGDLGHFLVFPMIPFMAFSQAASHPQLAPLLILAFLLVEIFDSFSLLGGQLYGRTPLVPQLSPRKTWEGLGTGATALAGAVLALAFGLGISLIPMLMIGLTVIAAALAGDLLGSVAKRRAGVKDYPPVITIQGGLLDIMDSWIVAGPAVVATNSIMNWFNG